MAMECIIESDVSSVLNLSLLQSRHRPYQKHAEDRLTRDTNREEQITHLRPIHKEALKYK